ncbi:unnamed protein product [Cladocopium goreaui]|uniref:Uncharacterized protein n=1 Tax=Cladocopium goreaui TaxID=2562237 RepID=A0A9P1BZI6_9DINO|nr:unnamed protein product [Cladocopium goreaui]
MNSPDNGVHECQSRIPKKHGLHRDNSFRNMAGIARVCQACLRPRVSQFSLVPTGRAGFATCAFTVPSRGPTPEQTLFVAGLNEGKFFGQDSAEETLKLVERVAQHSPEYTLLFGISDRRLAELEQDNKVKQGRLTPSRDLEGRLHCEMVPVLQAGMVDKRPRKHVGRSVFTDQVHVAWLLWKNPQEARKVYWAFWRQRHYKDAEARSFWAKHFPVSSYGYFEERAHIIAIRATEHMMALRKQFDVGGTAESSSPEPTKPDNKEMNNSTVLVVNNDIYDLVVQHLNDFLGKDAPENFNSQEFARKLRDTAEELCQDIIDLTPLLVFVYVILPLLIFQFFFNAGQYYLKQSGMLEQLMMGESSRRL